MIIRKHNSSPRRQLIHFALSRIVPTLLAAFIALAVGAASKHMNEGDLVTQVNAIPAQPEVRLPILMYHSILKDADRAGSYVVSPQTLENDLSYLKQRGFNTVTVCQLIDYVYHGAALPENPIMITFDDGHYNNLVYALPILERLDMTAVLSIVGEYTDRYTEHPDPNPNYGYLSWEETIKLERSSRFEIQNHSYNMHSSAKRKGVLRLAGESEQNYERTLSQDVTAVQNMMEQRLGHAATAFTYPLGLLDEQSERVLKKLGFKCTLSCHEKINVISTPDSLFRLGRFNRPSGIDTKQFMDAILDKLY